jgi:ABC-type amino acid transport system permease subunit
MSLFSILFSIFSFSFLLGSALGFRFKVFILAPTTVVAAIIAGAIIALRGEPALAIILSAVSTAIGLQIGYAAGTFAALVYGDLALSRAVQPSLKSSAETARTPVLNP